MGARRRPSASLSSPALACEADPDTLAEQRVVLIATVSGDDTVIGPFVRALREVPDYRIYGLAAGSGWLHLSEFTARWLAMRRKGGDPSHPDYAYFSQFRSDSRDGFQPSPNSDYRPMEELLRRRIKPAWIQYFNMSSVLCGVRMAVVSALALRTVNSGGARFKTPPSASDVLGFTHAFPLVSSSDDVGTYTTEQAVTSLHTFLTIFPHGKVGANITSLSLPPKGFHRQKIVPMNCTRIKGPHLGLRPSYERTGCTSTYALSVGFACSHSAPSTGRTAVHALLAVGFTGPTTPTLTPCRPPTAHPRSPIASNAEKRLKCLCAGAVPRCRHFEDKALLPWSSDFRRPLLRALLSFATSNPRVMVNTPRDFRNETSVARLLAFLNADSSGDESNVQRRPDTELVSRVLIAHRSATRKMAMRSSNMTEAVRALLKIHVCPHMDSSEREDSPTTFRHKGLFDQARLPSTQISGRAALPSD